MLEKWAQTPRVNRRFSSRNRLTRFNSYPQVPWPIIAIQNANLNQMIWSVAEQISKLSEAFELFPGDIIYSGTPENVGPVVRGDQIEMHIDGLPNLSVKIV